MEHRLRVYNTLTRQKEAFNTVVRDKVGMYVCGPTVYKPSHIGHMVGPVIFDTVKRYLTYLGYDVHWIVNITDVDDKLIHRARELGTTVKELSERMTADYVECLKKLNIAVLDPRGIDRMPKATEHIPEMIEIMRGLIDKGHAYAAAGDVYFDVTRDPDYGKLCNRDPEQLEAGVRIEVSEKKRNPGDFALWKGAKPGEPAWESPWGPGRPGWHIECSAMSMKYLGTTLDIHGGGLDLQFPHHENELAQSESYTEQPFSRYWMHNGLLKMGTAKMAGSVGNVINVADLLQKHSPETVRFLLLSTHYRSPIEYSDERLHEIWRSLEAFYRFFERYERIMAQSFYQLQPPMTPPPKDGIEKVPLVPDLYPFLENHRQVFRAHMDEDFNTGGAVGTLFDLLRDLNRWIDESNLDQPCHHNRSHDRLRRGAVLLRELSQILGLFWAPVQRAIPADDRLLSGVMQLLADVGVQSQANQRQGGDNAQLVDSLLKLLIDQRNEARRTKNFATADQIRKRLAELGVTLEDRAGGTGWRVG
jgi:cysteinyl-tRNA synthetase